MDTSQRISRAKQPRTVVAGPYGHPFHPIAVTIPIGAWISSIVFDIVALASDEPAAFVAGANVLIVIGLVGAVVAAVLGLMDLSQLTAGTPARRVALTHMTLNLSVTALFVVSLILRLTGDADDLSILGFILSIVAVLVLGVSGYLGGKLAYRYGVRVADEDTQEEGFRRTAT
ncbi:DUF2231 domain-containing protein [Microbacterium sp. NPDC058345]|uniref:DUF2231 domain-containing protein n=1 Tax=Microbacterium sp. NPDC058345 TaxID=3346455 RepID=UPI00364C22BC